LALGNFSLGGDGSNLGLPAYTSSLVIALTQMTVTVLSVRTKTRFGSERSLLELGEEFFLPMVFGKRTV